MLLLAKPALFEKKCFSLELQSIKKNKAKQVAVVMRETAEAALPPPRLLPWPSAMSFEMPCCVYLLITVGGSLIKRWQLGQNPGSLNTLPTLYA